jgi:hypothetical protein
VAAGPLVKDGISIKLDAKELRLTKGGQNLLSGSWISSSGLVSFGTAKSVTPTELHGRFGHLNHKIIKKSLKATNPPLEFIEASKGLSKLSCEDCIIGKRRAASIPKTSNNQELPELQEDQIQIDIQGPFPVLDFDENNCNVKLIDRKSGYLKFETLKTKTAAEMTNVFKRYQSRMERRTGMKIKSELDFLVLGTMTTPLK